MRILSVDYGRRRIGLARCDETEIIASGLDVIDRNKEKDIVLKICELINENEIGKVIVGYPYKNDGSKGELTGEIDSFISKLKEKAKIEIETVDEAYSSVAAHEFLHLRGMKRKKHKSQVDRIAACQILQTYLNKK